VRWRVPGFFLQLTHRLHHLVLEVLADADQVGVLDLLASLDVLAIRLGEVTLDGVVLEVDGLGAALLGLATPTGLPARRTVFLVLGNGRGHRQYHAQHQELPHDFLRAVPPPGFRGTSASAGIRRQRMKVLINPPTLATHS